jgi:inner membrane protein
MDTLSQIALGAAVGVAVMGRKTALWKAALMGAVVGTLPDLDVLIKHGDPIRDMTFHRTESHALFYLTLVAPLLALIVAKLAREMYLFKHWWLAVWLVLVTHPLLDTMTIYGTQLALPFSDYPFGVGSVFIIDPLYTLPLLIGTGIALARKQARGLRWNPGR